MESKPKKTAKIFTLITVFSASFIVGFIAPVTTNAVTPIKKIESIGVMQSAENSGVASSLSVSDFEPFLEVSKQSIEMMKTYETELVITTETPPVVEEALIEDESEKEDSGDHTLLGEPDAVTPIKKTKTLPISEPVQVPTKDCLEETPHLRSCWPGYEGGNEPTIQTAFNNLPGALRNKVPSDFILVNGCHPFSDRCPHGVMDSQGWGADGHCCDMPWARSIWISNRGINSGHLNDIMIHEAFHAVEYTTLSQDIRDRLSSEFGDSERAADGAVAYFGGNWQHYRGSGTGLTDSQSALFAEIFS